ncbi:MAG TPA: radical SAM protein [Longimicrobium sp.]
MKPTIDMQVSPYDRGAPETPVTLVKLGYTPGQRWVPSRYNARTVVEDGRLILWNTFTGAISVFGARDADRVLAWLDSGGSRGKLDSTGEYLHRRGYLVRDTVSEMDRFRYRWAQEQWRTDKLELILLTSEDCNFRCVYCYEKFARGTMTPEVRQGLMALTRNRAPTLRELQVSWFGGEPLYGWEAVEELAPVFHDVSRQHGIHYRQHMTTNGYLLTEERATRLLGWGLRDWQITIDGLPEDHDCKRVGRDGSGTYSTILDNLRSLRDRRGEEFKVKVRVNFDHRNFPRLGAFLEALSEDFAGDPRFVLRFRAVGKWGGSNDDNLDTCGLGEDRRVAQMLQKKADEVGLTQEGGIHQMATLGSGVCYAARPYSFIVGAHGDLMKCTVALYEEASNVVGKVLPDGTLELKDDHMLRWVNPAYETDQLCQHCHVLPVCQGAHCPLTRITDNRRTCCGIKGTLKQEMRFTLAEHDRARAAAAAPALAAAQA